jgi:hypothetical protein
MQNGYLKRTEAVIIRVHSIKGFGYAIFFNMTVHFNCGGKKFGVIDLSIFIQVLKGTSRQQLD